MAYQQLLEDCMDTPPGYIKDPIVRNIDKDQWLNRYQNQIEDLDLLLDEGIHVIYEDKKVYVKYKDVITFHIEHLVEVDNTCDDNNTALDKGYENNIYVESLGDAKLEVNTRETDIRNLPVYTESADTEDSKILGNFWISFVEHGLTQVLKSYNIK